MFTRTEKQAIDPKSPYELLVFTMKEGASEHSEGAVSHKLESDEVTIRSNVHSWGSIPVKGRENIQLLRDALTEVCRRMGIE